MPALRECKKIGWWPEGVAFASCCTCEFCHNTDLEPKCRNEFSPKYDKRVRFYNRCNLWREAAVLQN